MQIPNLVPLQSRLLVLKITSSFFITLWICLQPHHVVHASELPAPPEHAPLNGIEQSVPHVLAPVPPVDIRGSISSDGAVEDGGYVPDFAYFDRNLIGRQEVELIKLEYNKKQTGELAPEAVSFFRLEKSTRTEKRDGDLPPDSTSNSDTNTSGRSSEGNTLQGKHPGLEEALGESSAESLVEKRQAAGKKVWITANTCRQPSLMGLTTESDSPPQLNLYISSSEQRPGPLTSRESLVTDPIPFVKGFANFTTESDGDLFMGVAAPKLPPAWGGSWSFEIAASANGSYHNYLPKDYLYMVDTDSDSALFVTFNLSASNNTEEFEKWRNKMPFSMYAFPTNTSAPAIGLEHSYCGLKSLFTTNSTTNISVSTTVTHKFGGGRPKAQFNVQGLKMNETYTGFLAVDGGEEGLQLPLVTQDSDDPGEFFMVQGGGQVFAQWQWRTKSDDSCQVISDLEFCDNIAYAVPSSLKFKNDDQGLMKLYDDLASSYFQNFNNSLAQVACETTGTAQYSLARNCNDCRNDYKAWLCSVVFPRCEDYTAEGEWLHPRKVNTSFANGSFPYVANEGQRGRLAFNSSRVPMIDEKITPGPYKELLPCDYLCHNIVRSCPAVLGFSCPEGDALEHAYGRAKESFENLTCNFPGAVKILNRAVGAAPGTVRVDRVGMLVVAAVVGWFGVL